MKLANELKAPKLSAAIFLWKQNEDHDHEFDELYSAIIGTQILPFWQQKQVFEKTIEIGFIITNHGLLHLCCKRRKRIGWVHLAVQVKIISL